VISLLYAAQSEHPDVRVGARNRQSYLRVLGELLNPQQPHSVKETAVLAIGEVSRLGESTPDVLEILLSQLGSASGPLRSVAYTEVCLRRNLLTIALEDSKVSR
jgi:hypothetical protein